MKSSKFTLDPLIDELSGALFDTKQLHNRDGYETTKLVGYESSELGTHHLSTNRPWVRNDWLAQI